VSIIYIHDGFLHCCCIVSLLALLALHTLHKQGNIWQDKLGQTCGGFSFIQLWLHVNRCSKCSKMEVVANVIIPFSFYFEVIIKAINECSWKITKLSSYQYLMCHVSSNHNAWSCWWSCSVSFTYTSWLRLASSWMNGWLLHQCTIPVIWNRPMTVFPIFHF
jgi:hypothetical protein